MTDNKKKKRRERGNSDRDSSGGPKKIVVPSDDEIEEILSGKNATVQEGTEKPDAAEFRWPMDEEAAYALFEKAKERDSFLEELKKAKADLINYQNRVKKDRELWSRQAVKNLCLALLTVLDNFDLALKHAEEAPDDTDGLLEGIKITHSSLISALESFGVKPIEAKDEPFDPNFHEAMFTEPVPEHDEAMVLEEFRKGYMLEDWVLRATRVKVSEPGRPEVQEGNEEKGEEEDS